MSSVFLSESVYDKEIIIDIPECEIVVCQSAESTPEHVLELPMINFEDIYREISDDVNVDINTQQINNNVDQKTTNGTDVFLSNFKYTSDIALPVKNDEWNINFHTVRQILTDLFDDMVLNNTDLIHTWVYTGVDCCAVIGPNGKWRMYALISTQCINPDNTSSIIYAYRTMVYDDEHYICEIMMDADTNITLPTRRTDTICVGATFKDLSFCKAYVNTFVSIINGN